MIPKLADISMFEGLQAHVNAQMGVRPSTVLTPMSVFNANMGDIQSSVNKYMTQIDTLRSLGADSEAESEEGKLENILEEMNDRITTAIRTSRQTAVEFKRRGGSSDDAGSSSGSSDDTMDGMSDMSGDDISGSGADVDESMTDMPSLDDELKRR